MHSPAPIDSSLSGASIDSLQIPPSFENGHLHLSLFTISALFDPLLRQAMASGLKVEECSDASRCAFFLTTRRVCRCVVDALASASRGSRGDE